MRASIVATILRKELRETLRDRRTLLLAFGIPVLVYPLVILGFTRIAESGEDAIEARRLPVAVWGEAPAAIAQPLGAAEGLDARSWAEIPAAIRDGLADGTLTAPDIASDENEDEAAAGTRRGARERDGPSGEDAGHPLLAAARLAIATRRVEAVVVVWPSTGGLLAAGDAAPVTIYYDSVRRESSVARERLAGVLDDARRAIVAERQRARDLRPGFASGLLVQSRNTAPAERRAGQLLGTLLPYILLTLAVLGGLYTAIDLTAGEKERGTMQTLLCAPIRPAEIVVAKFLAVWVMSILAVVANLASLSLTLSRLLPPELPGIGWWNLVLTALILVPVTLTTAALFLAIACFARDFRDGQSLLTPIYMAVALPAAVVAVPTIELDPWTAFVPIVNIALLIKSLFLGDVSGDLVFLTLVSACAYAGVAIVAAVHVFHRESVLVGGRASLRTVFERRDGAATVPGPGLALTGFAVVLVIGFYASLLMRGWPIHWMLLTLQYGAFLAPTLALTALFGLDRRRVLALRRPPVVALLAAIVLGLSAWLFAGGVVTRLLPPPDSLTRAMQRFIQLGDDPMPLWVVWLVIGVTPAVCEELLFRGFVFAGFRRLGAWPAVLLSALLFALAHASIYRLLPTFILGVLLGLLRWRSGSTLPGMAMHAVNNGLIGTLAQRPGLAAWFGVDAASGAMPWLPVAAGTAAMGVAVAALWATTAASERSDDGR